MPPKSCQKPFQPSHAFDFGLKVVERDPNTKEVVSCHCEFCVYYGREAKVGTKRRKTTNIQYFKKPFQVENYKSHMELQHPAWWTKYSKLSIDGKKSYFQNDVPHQETIQAHFQGTQVPHHEFVDKTIVDGIIGDMYFHPEDEEQVKEGALSIFQENNAQCYRFTIKNPLQFSLVVHYLSIGVSFRMAVSILLRTKEHTGLGSVGSISEKSEVLCWVCLCN